MTELSHGQKKKAFMCFAFISLGIIIGVEMLNAQLISWLITAPENTTLNGNFFESITVHNTENYDQDSVNLPKNLTKYLDIFTWYVTLVFFWILWWFRLKETEAA